tara:strand:- start:1091 stop:3283 length:2193 start_codon:yes stop_codon:yes gene_type:complete
MKKVILYFFLFIALSIITFLYFFIFIGIETKSFNNKINESINKFDKNLEIEIDKVQLYLNLNDLNIEANILNPKIIFKNEIFEVENLKSLISLKSIINKEFPINNLNIYTKSTKLEKVISLVRLINNSPQIFILQNKIKDGFLVAEIKMNFDENGKIKNDFEINGYLKEGQINLISEYNLNKIDFIFNIKKKEYKFKDIQFSLNQFNFSSKKIFFTKKNKHIHVGGNISNENLKMNKKDIDNILKLFSKDYNFEKIYFSSENNFSFDIDNEFKISKLFTKSTIRLNHLSFNNKKRGKYFFPKINNQISFKDHNIKLNLRDSIFLISGSGDILLQKKIDKINYSISSTDKSYQIKTSLELNQNPLLIEFLNYKKNEDSKAILQTDFSIKKNKNIKIKNINIRENNNQFILENIFLDKNFKIIKMDKIDLDYIDKDGKENSIEIIRSKNTYDLTGTRFNADNLITKVLDTGENKYDLFKEDFNVNIKIDHIDIDENNNLKNFKGTLNVKNNSVNSAELRSIFSNNEQFILSIKTENNQKITNFFSEKAKPLVKRYNFIKGFEGGTLEYYSKKISNESSASLKIYDFKLQELPALTKLLTLASLQGIADTFTGEGIRFNELEMNFSNQGNLMTIDELYAIGPAISILMNGYIEKDKLVSLRGTLVPATTINKTIGSIPFLGKLLVGSKVGEGVFGVSFKIKGHPDNLETKVNPIKTLTPRFITRTLEKIKKTN